jgi:multicomponent Na+:H+ antiporter subunit B
MSGSDDATGADETADEPGTLSRPAAEEPAYVESTIIMTTVRVIAPFVLTLGLFVMFHGAGSAGGGFQGGVIAATTVVMLGFAFGIEPVSNRLRSEHLAALVLAGLGVFLAVGLGPLALGGTFLQFGLFPVPHASKYSIELIELGIGVVVSGVITGLFFLWPAGVDSPRGGTGGDAEADDDSEVTG